MRLLQAASTSVGSKILIALTGLGLGVFLIAHLAGNLLFLAGPEAFNEYSHKLISNPLIYLAEAGLLAIFVLHLLKAVGGFMANQAARPQAYAAKRWAKTKNPKSRKSFASSTMIVTGTIILLFVVTHLFTFKFGPVYETPAGLRDLYRLQVEVFSNPGYVGFYLLAMGSGQPRSRKALVAMLERAGFVGIRPIRTRMPLQTSLLVAQTPGVSKNPRSGL